MIFRCPREANQEMTSVARSTIDSGETADWTATNEQVLVIRFAKAKISLFDGAIRDLIARCPKYLAIPFAADSCGWRLCILHEARKQARDALARVLAGPPAHVFNEFLIIEKHSDLLLADHIRQEIRYMQEEMDLYRVELQLSACSI